jgi:hypothetical protein
MLSLQKTGNCYSAHENSSTLLHSIQKADNIRVFNAGKRGEMALASGNLSCSNIYYSSKFSADTDAGNRHSLSISTFIITRLTGFINISASRSISLIFPFHYFW